MKSNFAVQDAINKCFKDVPEQDAQSDPVGQMNKLKVEYEKLVKEYKKAVKQSDEDGSEIESSNDEPEEEEKESDMNENKIEAGVEDTQNDEKMDDKDGDNSVVEDSEVNSNDSSEDESMIDGIKDVEKDKIANDEQVVAKESAEDANDNTKVDALKEPNPVESFEDKFNDNGTMDLPNESDGIPGNSKNEEDEKVEKLREDNKAEDLPNDEVTDEYDLHIYENNPFSDYAIRNLEDESDDNYYGEDDDDRSSLKDPGNELGQRRQIL